MAMGVHMYKSQTTRKIKHNSDVFWPGTYTTVNVIESLRETGYLYKVNNDNKESFQKKLLLISRVFCLWTLLRPIQK